MCCPLEVGAVAPHRWVHFPSSIGWWGFGGLEAEAGGSLGWRGAGRVIGCSCQEPSQLPSGLPGPLSTCAQCLILACLFSDVGFAGFSAMAKLSSLRVASGSGPVGGAGLLGRGAGPAVAGGTWAPLAHSHDHFCPAHRGSLFQGLAVLPRPNGRWVSGCRRLREPAPFPPTSLHSLLRVRE